ncbi:hypothetical protein [Methanoculleus sp.]|uniref:hypothetical protein n=1 Tax=Methanoculleus sp. TaxID=90427 RepID=UPI002635E6DC|nr:hypothetical protein [Methanoculleus sp.]
MRAVSPGGRDARLTGKVYIDADGAPLDESHQGTLDLFSAGAAGGDVWREQGTGPGFSASLEPIPSTTPSTP